MVYRLDKLSFPDREAGTVEIRGDGFASAGEMATLLESPDVQRFVGMSPDEIARSGAMAAAYREALKGAHAGDTWTPPQLDPATAPARERLAAEAQALLGADRWHRLVQLSWRIRGAEALTDDHLVALLGLTDDQRKRLGEIAQQNETDQARVLNSFGAVRLRDPRQLEDRSLAAHRAGQQKMLDVLTPQQRAQFSRLLETKP